MAKAPQSSEKPEITNFGIGVTDDLDSGIDLNYIPRDEGGSSPPIPIPDPPSGCKGVGSASINLVNEFRNRIYK